MSLAPSLLGSELVECWLWKVLSLLVHKRSTCVCMCVYHLQVLHRLPGHISRVFVALPLDLIYESAIVEPVVLDDLFYAVFIFVILVLVIFIVLLLCRFRGFLVYAGGDLVGNIVFAAGFVVGDGGYQCRVLVRAGLLRKEWVCGRTRHRVWSAFVSTDVTDVTGGGWVALRLGLRANTV